MTRSFPAGIVLALLVCATTSRPTRAEDAEGNLARIKAMSRADRARMSKSLETFDALDPPRRDAVRELNERLAGLDAKTHDRYLEIMRRYHVFYQSLPREKRDALDRETDSAKKLELIAAYRAEQRKLPIADKILTDGIQVSTLTMAHEGQSPQRLRGMARDLIVYFSQDPGIDATLRSNLERSKTPAERDALVTNLFKGRPRNELQALREKLREEQEEFLVAEESVFIKNPASAKRLLKAEFDAAKADFLARKATVPRAKAAVTKTEDPATKRRRSLIMVLDELEVLREMDEETVRPASLDRFEAALPSWARESLDALPPDAARKRLKALYRIVYPSPEEMPLPKNSKPPKTVRPAAPRAAGTNPF